MCSGITSPILQINKLKLRELEEHTQKPERKQMVEPSVNSWSSEFSSPVSHYKATASDKHLGEGTQEKQESKVVIPLSEWLTDEF